MSVEEDIEQGRKDFLKQKFDEIMKNHLCGNYISLENDECVEWFTNYDTEQFVALTEYGSFHHQYDWESSYDSNLEAFVEELFQFILDNEIQETLQKGVENAIDKNKSEKAN